jgi:hypothetical protein
LFKIQKNESVHSYIYRTHIVNGVSDFSNIIATGGGWASFPKLLKGTLHLYKPIDDLNFLNMLRDIGLAKITYKALNDPVAYRDDLEMFFGQYKGNRIVRQGALPITYCLKCIKSHIRKFGFGIIDVTWSRNSFCPIHKADLNTAKVTNRKDAIEALNHILRGAHPKAYESPSYRREHFHDSRKYYHEKNSDHIAPCLADDLKEFIKANWKSFPKDLLDRNYSSENYLTKPYMMTKIYESAKNIKYKRFEDFWKNFAEIKYIDSGVVNRKAITEAIYKSTKIACQNCKHLSCFSNLAIIPTRVDERLTKKCELNQRLLLDYLQNMGISNNVKRKKIMRKMSAKQKMRALSEFRGDRFDRRYKIALDNARFAYAEPYLMFPED